MALLIGYYEENSYRGLKIGTGQIEHVIGISKKRDSGNVSGSGPRECGPSKQSDSRTGCENRSTS